MTARARIRKTSSRRGYPLPSRRGYSVIEEITPLDSLHGAVPLTLFPQVVPADLARASNDPGLYRFHHQGALFLDIETTGLAPGGTSAFLVGTMACEGTQLILRQFLMEDPAAEAEMLAEVHSFARGFDGLVTYNGKSFDVPVLRARLMHHGVAEDLESAWHLDLLHTTRRIWKGHLPSCRLKTVERHLLGFHREGDVEGWQIPGIYGDYLERGARDLLQVVIAHNAMDILSMVALVIIAARAGLGGGIVPGVPERIGKAKTPVARAREAGQGSAPADPRHEALQSLHAILVAKKRWAEAERNLRELMVIAPRDPFAYREMAMLLARDVAAAEAPAKSRKAATRGKSHA